MNVQGLLDAINQMQNEPDLNTEAVWAISIYLSEFWKDDPARVLRAYHLGNAMSNFFVDLTQHRLPEKIASPTSEIDANLARLLGASTGSLSKFWTQCLQIWSVTLKSDQEFASEVKQYFDMLLRSSMRGRSETNPLASTAHPALTTDLSEAAFAEPTAPALDMMDNKPAPPIEGSVSPISVRTADPESISASTPVTNGFVALTPAKTHFSEEPESIKLPRPAYLILRGNRVIPLTQPFIKIGRQMDNHIIIEDPRVSRSHAQLKLTDNGFVIFDMHSTGGTFVNGKQVDQSVLYPGDVISLAGIILIYSQELPAQPGSIQVIELGSRLASNRPTSVIRREEIKSLPDLPRN